MSVTQKAVSAPSWQEAYTAHRHTGAGAGVALSLAGAREDQARPKLSLGAVPARGGRAGRRQCPPTPAWGGRVRHSRKSAEASLLCPGPAMPARPALGRGRVGPVVAYDAQENFPAAQARQGVNPSYATEGQDCPTNKDLRSILGESFHYIGTNSSILRRRRGRVTPRRWSSTFWASSASVTHRSRTVPL